MGLCAIATSAAAACIGSEPQRGETSEAVVSRFAASDVTVLAPLTSLDAMASRDGLVPDEVASRIGMLVEHYPAEDSLERLRVVCTRFDPAGQIRLVLQPLIVTDGVLGAQDAAVHVFYDLDAPTTRALAARLAAPHEAGAVMREFVARGALSRVTFMRNTDVKGNGWSFGGFDVRGGQPMALEIPRTGGHEQNVVIHGAGPFATSLAPAPEGAATLGLLLDPVRLGVLLDANPDSARAQIDQGVSAAYALEDPARFTTSTADCASCHVAESARIYGVATKAGTAPERRFSAPETLRACGYVGTRAIVSRRTQNESALAAQKMGELL